jgi:N-methylhydantoinase B
VEIMSYQADTIRYQVMWNRLLAIVEEQAQTLIRTSFSTTTREGGDVSAGVYDRTGRMLAQAETGTPGHINSMARAVPHFIEKLGYDNMFPGDTYITNDPWKGTGHLHDFTVVSPCFNGDAVIGFFACTSHVVDIGGVGFTVEGRQVYHEGLQIPIMKFAERGVVNAWFVDLLRTNVREPVQVVGDLYALAACNDNAVKSLDRLMREYDETDLMGVGDFIIDSTRAAMLDAFARLPKGKASSVMRTDGLDKAIDLACTVTIEDDRILVDFEGTSPTSEWGINCPMCYTAAYACFAVKAVVAPKVPNNTGSLDTVEIVAPDDTIVNAPYPCAVAVRSVVGHLVPDAVFGCLHQLLPGEVPSEGTGSLWGLKAGAGHGLTDSAYKNKQTPFTLMSLHSGGAGARPSLDGLNATPFPSGVKNVPVEVTEAITPLVVWEKSLRTDSGGAGRTRGGLGQTMVVGNREEAPFVVFATFDRVEHPPQGREGGRRGANGVVRLDTGEKLKAKGAQTVPVGAKLVLEMPGGGGYGDPHDRPLAVIERDLKKGYISEAAARDLYGVRFGPDGSLRREETN